MLGQEDNSIATKWTYFNKQACAKFLCSWIISQALVDCTDIGRSIGCITDEVYTPSTVSIRGSIGSTTSFFYIHQWYYTQDLMIIYVYINLYMKACYLHHQKTIVWKIFIEQCHPWS